MQNEHVVLDKPKVQRALQDFIFIKLYTNTIDDAFNARVRKLREDFGAAANPWYLFLAPNGGELDHFGGVLTVQGFLARLEKAKVSARRLAATRTAATPPEGEERHG